MTNPAAPTAQEKAEALKARLAYEGRDAIFELTNGTKLRCKPIPPLYLQAVNERFQAPVPPRVKDEETGREEVNLLDPGYRAEVERLDAEHQRATTNLVLGMGTEIAELGEGMYGPESEEWVTEIRWREKFTGQEIEIPDDKDLRYVAWLRLYALTSNPDIAVVGMLPQMLAGLDEDEIMAAVNVVRGKPVETPPPTPMNRAARRARNGAS